MRIPRGVRIGRNGPMVNSIARRRARNGVAGPTSISLSATSFDEDAEAGSTIAFITAESDTGGATYTFDITEDASGRFAIDGDELKLASSLPSGEEIFLRDVTIRATIDQTGGAASETFTLVIEPADTSNDSGLADTDGSLVAVGEFTLAPSVKGTNGALKFKGRTGGLAYFVFDIGAAEPGGIYTYSYIPYFQELSNQGKEAFVGFGFKTGDSFHLSGLKGDGSTGLTKHKIFGTSLNSFTSTGSGAPTNGTQAGPNFIQIEISSDGNTYTFRTSADGATWADEFTASTPGPFSDTGSTQFGLAVFLENSDKGRFSLDVTEWALVLPLSISGTPVLEATQSTAYAGFTATASNGTAPYTYSLVGTWPAGITINASTGAVSGTPTGSGSFTGLSVRVTDAASDTADLTTFSIAVAAAPYADSKFSLALEFTGANGSTTITDLSSYAHTATVGGDAQINGNALLLDGTGDYVSFPDSDAFYLGAGNFSFSFDFMPAVVTSPAANSFIAGQYQAGAAADRAFAFLVNNTGGVRFFYKTEENSSTYQMTVGAISSLFSTTEMRNLKVVRTGSDFAFYVNNSLVNTVTMTGNTLRNSAMPFVIGAASDLTGFYACKVDNMILIKGATS
jgi:hypothetical protein